MSTGANNAAAGSFATAMYAPWTAIVTLPVAGGLSAASSLFGAVQMLAGYAANNQQQANGGGASATAGVIPPAIGATGPAGTGIGIGLSYIGGFFFG